MVRNVARPRLPDCHLRVAWQPGGSRSAEKAVVEGEVFMSLNRFANDHRRPVLGQGRKQPAGKGEVLCARNAQ